MSGQRKAPPAEEAARVKRVLEENRIRNETYKKSIEWLGDAYSGLKIKRLNDIPPDEFPAYKKYLAHDELYIVVHPGYFIFFENDRVYPVQETIGGLPADNVVDRIGNAAIRDHQNLQIMVEEERFMRKFLEFMAAEKRLVLIAIPRNYRETMSLKSPEGLDEYARYINDMTNGAESMLFMETETSGSGYMTKADQALLARFLKDSGVKRIMFGGGYVGKCIDNFYEQLKGFFQEGKTFLVPEISAVSPMDGSFDRMLKEDGQINMKYKIKVLKMHGPSIPRIKRFSLFTFPGKDS